ncbi:NAD(P)-dependent oxidoreductase [Methylophilaceae bacterium]|nr:NAD(P)-dependent oxidoreductase [Methylophilaceae bacterium]
MMIKYDIESDLNFIFNNCKKEFNLLSNKSLLITGGTGFFGKWFLSLIFYTNKNYNTNILTTLITRDQNKFFLENPHYKNNKFLKIIQIDILDLKKITNKFDFLLHMAATSAEETFNGETDNNKTKTLFNGTKNIMEIAIENNISKILFTSSGVVYGSSSKDMKDESDVCHSLELEKRNGLAKGKILAEDIISKMSIENNINFKIARCFSFVGPYLPLDIHYAIGNFINDAIFNENILINGNGSPYRSYLYISDTLIWLIKLLVRDVEGIFNVGSERRIQVIELANMVRDIIAPSKKVIIQDKNLHEGNFRRDIYLPNTEKIREALEVREWTSLEDAILKTAKFTL